MNAPVEHNGGADPLVRTARHEDSRRCGPGGAPHRTLIVLALLALSGCAVGPNYKRPAVALPADFRGADERENANSLADVKWFDLFQDDVLKQLIQTALERNYDLRIAAERVLESRARLGITRSNLLPTFNGTAQYTANNSSEIGSIAFLPAGRKADVSYTQAGFTLGWELDVWGRIRRLTESARAQYLASDEARRGVITTLVADVTTHYFQLRELDLELDIARKTREIAENSLRLTTLRRNSGAATGLDVHQSEQFLYTATAQIAVIERSIGQTENAINLLLGRPPGDVARGKALQDFIAPAEVPPGLPSKLLERRPDIRQAEMSLVSANAEIGAAKAQYFPQISLTGFLGGQSRALTELFTSAAGFSNFSPGATLPIFNAGRIRSNVRLTEAQQRETLINYEKTIQNAFREVSDALIGYRKTSEQRAQQELLVKALIETDRLSTLRYRGGLDSYLQVLDAERNLFQGQLLQSQLRREELLAVVQLYRALGGGWQ
jgi:NodT family efflux transporter outer membrane factor (OMF) lipoprotein